MTNDLNNLFDELRTIPSGLGCMDALCEGCEQEEKERKELEQEIETLIKKETIEEITEYAKKEYLKIGIPSKAGDFLYEAVRNFALSKGIRLD